MNKSSTPLDVLRLDQPCQVPWDAMAGDGRSRFCEQCNLHVTNLSSMTREEAEAFLANRTGRVCVAYARKADGSPWTLDSQPARPARRGLRAAAAAAAVALSVAAGEASFQQPTMAGRIAPPTTRPTPPGPMAAGGLCPPTTQPLPPTPLFLGKVSSPPAPTILGEVALPTAPVTRPSDVAPSTQPAVPDNNP